MLNHLTTTGQVNSVTTRLQCRDKELIIGERTLVMGILNVTPDSFSDGGRYNDVNKAVEHAKRLVESGSDIIDIGGESTRPGANWVPAEEEIRRIVPMIEEISKQVDVPISVDTYKAAVARKAIEAGAHIINDIWGCMKDPEMAITAAEYGVPIILMHNRDNMNYGVFMEDLLDDLQRSVDIALAAGVRKQHIILDPGIGFAKTYTHNLETMAKLDQVVNLGYPVLLGTSRKSMIGNTLGLPVEERLEGTAATVTFGIMKGCHIVRVHDVKEMARVARMTDAILHWEQHV